MTYLLKRALLDLDRQHAHHLADCGVNARELGVLLFLDGGEPASQQDASDRMGVDRTTMVRLVDGLEAKGLVERRAAQEDRRRNVLVVTPVGQTSLRRALEASDRAERELLEVLDEAEAAQLRALLGRIGTDHLVPEDAR